jgi:5,10-methylene-tetrahydrofolate dehydrogenase/methenyl tetrahydrofolate cyclohydrolase
MRGAELAARIRAEVAREVDELGDVCLATVLVGDDPASHIYIEKKHEARGSSRATCGCRGPRPRRTCSRSSTS